MPDKLALISFVKKSAETNATGTARLLETLRLDEAAGIIKNLSTSSAEKIMGKLNPVFAAGLFSHFPKELTTELLDRIEPERAMTLFLNLPVDVREPFIEQLDEKKKERVRELLTYPEDSAGRLMNTRVLKIPIHLSVGEAITKVREAAQKKMPPSYAYIVDQDDKLCGVMTMRDALLASREDKVEAIMKKSVFNVDPFLSSEQVAALLRVKKYFAAPVVDSENRLLGIINADKVFKEVQEDAAEDIQQLFGVSKDETVFSTLGFSVRKRLPWLQVNLVTAFLAASVVALFEDIIAKITALAIFLPVVAGQGGNAGAQSLAVVMRGLVMREISPQKVKSVLVKETTLGAINGVVTGIITGIVAWLWKGNGYLGVVIGLGMVVNLIIAGFAGAIIPLAMKKVGFDPAQCSNIILTTVTDVMGFLAFLGFAVLFQNYLV